MKPKIKEITVEVDGIDLVVEYYISGEDRPATRYDPAEFAELIVTSVKVPDSDIDIQGLLSDGQLLNIDEQIYEYERD